ncbi:aldo/keto reductase [Chitinophaga oryzae]|uniref:Aldo/keto reductase n=1 Tax=Chitinophaga oryzae TaxID=2725414 RepID=A0AAE6ZFZ3_9BACT|nr:aldo/keto reductase [Chitinophaga oryzae]QJB31911.1 aldo/keto reductase [Chitinophaga oryzae]QJB38388.1 aldo/keto reductase [Chitinophaga oryzae]
MNAKSIVLGTAGLGGVWGRTDRLASVRTILTALDNGITALDTAPAYGNAEEIVGSALKEWRGPMPVISTKAGRLRSFAADEARYDYSPAGIMNSVHHSLKTLGIPALDILFLHDPEAVPEEEAENVIGVMQHLKQLGLVKKIGLGGNIPLWMEADIKTGVFDAIMEFNRLNACNVAALQDRLPFCQDRGMAYYAASPLHMGLLGRNFHAWQQQPPSWMPAGRIATAQRLQQIAASHQLSLPAMAHRFLLNIPHTFNIVMGASAPEELEDSLSAFREGPLPAAVYQDILDCNK